MHRRLTFDVSASAPSVTRGNENLDVGLECKAFPPHSDILQKVIPYHGLRKIWLLGIIRQSYGNFSNRISDSDCPFQDKSGTKFSRSKAFMSLNRRLSLRLICSSLEYIGILLLTANLTLDSKWSSVKQEYVVLIIFFVENVDSQRIRQHNVSNKDMLKSVLKDQWEKISAEKPQDLLVQCRIDFRRFTNVEINQPATK
ncbi:hypothetical protein TNCV_3446931 [Trichonephila clavipes]|nr:hypothetical protein TNCV_3446931 [Trichonephila clavipes]